MSRSKNIQLIGQHGTFSSDELSVGAGDHALDHIQPDHLENSFLFRGWHGWPTYISSFYREDDVGSHGEGRANDQILFKDYLQTPLDPLAMYYRATTWPFLGVGLYLDWVFTNRQTGKRQRTPGLHTDDSRKRRRPLRWIAFSLDGRGRSVAPLLMDATKRKGVRRWFYYQDPSDGLFKNSEREAGYTITEAVEKFFPNV